MNNNGNWKDFCKDNIEVATEIAKKQFYMIKGTYSKWDVRIDEDAIINDAVTDSLQKAFLNYNPSRGAKLETYIHTIIHNEIIDGLDREKKALSVVKDLNPKQEADYTIGNIVANIPEEAWSDLSRRLHDAISKLPPIEQTILDFFLKEPKTFVQRSVDELHISPNYVSVHKNRAIKHLPSLMKMTPRDYHAMFEEQSYAGEFMQMLVVRHVQRYINPLYPQFDLDDTVERLCNALISAREENM